MVAALFALWLSALIASCAFGAPVTLKNFNQGYADDYLEKYGYMELFPAGSKSGVEGQQLEQQRQQSRQKAVSTFQKYVGLPVTGKLDDATKTRMLAPRCGQADIAKTLRDGLEYKWDKSRLQWTLVTPTSQIEDGAVRTAISQALDVWSAVAPFDFFEVSSQSDADLQVGFGRGQHGDAWPFDGQGNVLAHATYPTGGRLHFDDDETWVFNDPAKLESDPNAIDLLTVAIHEMGHALGVQHLRERESIMYPIYLPPAIENGQMQLPKLSAFDIQAIQRLYGPRKGPGARPTKAPVAPTTKIPVRTVRPPQRPPQTDPPQDEPQPIPDGPTGGACPQFQASVTGTDGATYFFNGNTVWKKANANSGSTASSKFYVDKLFPGAPTSITAALTSTMSQLTLLFQGNKVFGFSWSNGKFVLQKDFSKTVPFEPQGAFQWKDGNLVLYKGQEFVIWDDYWNKITFKNTLSNYFPNLPANAKASFALGDQLCFLNGANYSIYDMHASDVTSTKALKTLITC